MNTTTKTITFMTILITALLVLSGCNEKAGEAYNFRPVEQGKFQQCINLDCAGLRTNSIEYRECTRACADEYKNGGVVAEIPHTESADAPQTDTPSGSDIRGASQETEGSQDDISEPDVVVVAQDDQDPEVIVSDESEEEAPQTPTSSRIDPASLSYQGAFRMPDGGTDETGWLWGGTAATYYPQGDPSGPVDGYPGSIFATGHEWNQYVAEISIPAPVLTRDLSAMNTAGMLQEFADIKDDMFGYLEQPRVGLAYLPKQGIQDSGKLYYTWSQHMAEGETGPSTGWFNTDLSHPEVKGPWSVDGRWQYITADYMFEIPASFADTYLDGYRLATGRFRDGGQGSQGPSLIAIAPWKDGNPPHTGATLSSKEVLLYSSVYDDEYGARSVDNYCPSSWWSGGEWLTDGSASALIFAGRRGVGTCWYGYEDGTSWYTYGEDTEWREGPVREELQRGWWADEFRAQILFYDTADLAAVAQGTMEPWEPQPYAVLDIEDKMMNHEQGIRQLGSVAFDRNDGILYVLEHLGDSENERPIVHVWKLT